MSLAEAPSRPRSTSRTAARVMLAVAAPLLALAIAEVALWAAGFHRESVGAPMILTSRDMATRAVTVADDELFWTLRPSADLEAWGLSFTTDERGCRGGLESAAKPAGTLRIVCLGDSTTFGNFTSWPEQLERVLAERAARAIEVVNAGVPGYSSFQARRFFERRLAALDPDIVLFCAGFNDGRPLLGKLGDREIARARSGGAAASPLVRAVLALRTTQALRALVDRVAPAGGARGGASRTRVSVVEYLDNVRALRDACADAGAAFVALTEPHAYRRADPAALEPDLRAIHASFRAHLDRVNAALRAEAAASPGLRVFDLARAFESLDAEALFVPPGDSFDHIHPNPIGHRAWAELVAAFLARERMPPFEAASSASAAPPARSATPAEPMARAASVFAAAPLDVDGDGRDEVVVAAAVDGAITAAAADPHTGRCTPLHLELPAPAAPLGLCALGGELSFVLPRAEGGTTWFTRRFDLSRGTRAPAAPSVMHASGALRLVEADLDGDGRAEPAGAFAEPGPSRVVLWRADFAEPRVVNAHRPDWPGGVSLAAGRVLAPDRDALLVGPLRCGSPNARRDSGSEDGAVAFALHPWLAAFGAGGRVDLPVPYLLLEHPPVLAVAGRFATRAPDDAPEDALDDVVALRPPAAALLDRARGIYGEPFFPFGAVTVDASIAAPALARVPASDGRPAFVVAAVRAADGAVHACRIEGAGGAAGVAGARVSAAVRIDVE